MHTITEIHTVSDIFGPALTRNLEPVIDTSGVRVTYTADDATRVL